MDPEALTEALRGTRLVMLAALLELRTEPVRNPAWHRPCITIQWLSSRLIIPSPMDPMERLAHYTILEKIGEGGMGQVYRAQDTRLKREVAIKVLPEVFTKDPERLARFEREAQVLASLQHPHVAGIFGLEQHEGKRFLALELVPGEDLAKRLKQAAIPLDEALTIAIQIAEAVEAAHEHGIVHRDLKPSNVMLTPEGQAKVLDFGLAKAVEGDPSDSRPDLTRSPTLTGLLTDANVILGTAAYMAPEQARGKKVDKRADIWAFGVILFEMLSGERLFEGETVSDLLASVLKTDPDWERLPGDTPPHVRKLLERCLDRDPRTRLRDMGEARILLARGADAAPTTVEEAARGIRRPLLVAIAAACLVVGAGLGALLLRPASSTPEAAMPRMLSLDAGPGDAAPYDPTLSPDGSRVAYIRKSSIWVRDLSTLEPRHLERTANVMDLFWSPDGSRIGYLTTEHVMTVDPVEGTPVVVASVGALITENSGAGGTWSADQGILYARGHDDIFRVSDRGGDPSVYAYHDSTREGDLHEPALLPDGGLLVVPHLQSDEGLSTVEVHYGNERILVTNTTGSRVYHPIWSPTGHILYERRAGNPGIWAVPWNLAGRRQAGEPFLVFPHGSFPSIASDGTLVLMQGMEAGRMQVVESDRAGRVLRNVGETRRYQFQLDLSPDGNRLAVVRSEEENSEIWIHDLARGTESRLTFFRGLKFDPRWSPDGRTMSYYVGSGLAALRTIIQPTDGKAGIDTLESKSIGASFVPGTNDLIYSIYTDEGEFDLFVGPATRDGERRLLVQDTGWQLAGVVSPDDKYIAYVSRETGVDQVYLKRFPEGSGKWQVSIESGQWPQWNTAGDKLVYARGDDIVEVAVDTSDPPVMGRPQLLFERPGLGFQLSFGFAPHFTMRGDGERFYFFYPSEGEGLHTTMVLYQNWIRAFEK